jgi:4-amino-4-deoxy-L-arabinose transferase-like glycosyltransferase
LKSLLQDERRLLASLLAAAFVVRVAAALTTLVVPHDGARFTLMARYFEDGRWDEGLSVWPPMSPLYPILIWLFGSGAAVSVVLGTLTLLPVYALARAVWDRRIAGLAAGILAFLPDSIGYGSTVMGEMPFCFFFFCAMEMVRRAAEHGRRLDGVWAGIAGGLAALLRPEGIYVLAAAAVWPAARAATLGGWERRLSSAALAGVVFVAVVFPYARWVHEKTGRWSINISPFTQELAHQMGLAAQGSTEPHPLEGAMVDVANEYEEERMAGKYGAVAGRLLHYTEQVVRLCGYALFPFLLWGAARLRRRADELFAAGVGFAYLLPPMLMLFARLPFSHRYLIPGVLFWAPVMALGLEGFGRWAARRIPEGRRARAAALGLGLLAAAFTVKAVRPSGLHRRTMADAGSWIRAHDDSPRPVLIAMDRRIGHYAEGYMHIAPMKFPRLLDMVRETGARWVVTVDKELARTEPGYPEALEKTYPLAHVVPRSERGHEVRIYRVPR